MRGGMAGMLEDTSSCPITCTCFALRIPTPRHYRILSEHGNVGVVGEFPKCRGQRPRLQARFGSGNFSIISCVAKKATTKNGTMFAIIQSGPTWRKAPPNGYSLEKLRRFVSNNLCNSRECRPRVAGFARLTKFGKSRGRRPRLQSRFAGVSAPRRRARAQGPGRSRLQRVLSTRLCAKA